MRRALVLLGIVLLPGPAVPSVLAQAPPAVPAAQAGGGSSGLNPDGFIEPWIGFHFSGGFIDAFTDRDTTTTKSYGVSLGFLQRGLVGGEFELGYSPDYFSDANSSIVGGNNLLTLTASMMIGPWIKGVRPYGVIGGGLARSKIEDFVKFGSDVQNRGVIDYGGGVSIYFAKHIGVRGDVRFLRDFGSHGCESESIVCDVTFGWGVTDNVYRRMHFGALLAF